MCLASSSIHSTLSLCQKLLYYFNSDHGSVEWQIIVHKIGFKIKVIVYNYIIIYIYMYMYIYIYIYIYIYVM